MEGPVASDSALGESCSASGAGGDDASQKKANQRKRTKTGCLTCRRRRIKCDEGKPICNNCIKSKRPCEGYSKRVIFKDPMGALPFQGPYATSGYLEGDEHFLDGIAAQSMRSSGHGQLPMIAPKPPSAHGLPYGQQVQGLPIGTSPVTFELSTDTALYGSYPPQPSPPRTMPSAPGTHQPEFSDYIPSDQTLIRPPASPSLHPSAPKLQYIADNPSATLKHVESNTSHDQSSHNKVMKPPSTAPPELTVFADEKTSIVETEGTLLPLSRVGLDAYGLAKLNMTRPSIDDDSDSSVESDVEMQNPDSYLSSEIGHLPGGDAPQGTQARYFASFAESQDLVEYMKALDFVCASELKDEAKRRIFGHFIRVTGPSMSLYDRNPFGALNPLSDNQMNEGSSIWTSTFPMKSFKHSGLLCAILAVGSLQIAYLKEVPPTVAIRQYAMAIRRIKKYFKDPNNFSDPAMLAAILLLGYFEVWNGEHGKWCSHLLGARNIFKHLPMREMSRRFLPIKARREQRKIMAKMGLAGIGQPRPKDPHALDFDLLTTITGMHITPKDYGLHELETQYDYNEETESTTAQIEEFEHFRDLFWWYCKMEIYQSILGATSILMDYAHWTQCPPRGPASNADGIYGTYDHLMLLLGRLADFAARDWPRKRRVDQARKTEKGSSPPFPGLVPTNDSVRPSMSFGVATEKPTRWTQADDGGQKIDPSASMDEAVKEWESIRHAFEAFEKYLGPEFRPLSAEYADRRDRPFGGVLQYRTFSIAGIWMNFYMGMIHLYRSHPTMSAAAIAAAGQSAHKTAEYANKVGRVAIGLSGDCSHVTEISTLMGAAFIESAFCMFVAAVQYQDAEQRHWVVRRMLDIARLTGWQSAREIANGCESTWIKAAQVGRGPPYKRATDLDETSKNSSIWDRPRRIDKKIHGIDSDKDISHIPVIEQSRRAFYAVGLLAVEEDMEHLGLN